MHLFCRHDQYPPHLSLKLIFPCAASTFLNTLLFLHIRRIARCVPVVQKLIVHPCHEHLEAGLLLYGEKLAHIIGHNLNVLLLQVGYAPALNDEHLHQCGGAGSVENQHDFLAFPDIQVSQKAVQHDLSCFIG